MHKRKRNLFYPITQTERLEKLKQSLLDWKKLCDHDLAFTIMLKRDLPRQRALDLFALFWYKTDQDFLGNAAKRSGKRLNRSVFFEKGSPLTTNGKNSYGNWHEHGTLQKPFGLSLRKFEMRLNLIANKLDDIKDIQLTDITNEIGWNQYITKQTGEDLENLVVEQSTYKRPPVKLEDLELKLSLFDFGC